jgi:hypothetical protein
VSGPGFGKKHKTKAVILSEDRIFFAAAQNVGMTNFPEQKNNSPNILINAG